MYITTYTQNDHVLKFQQNISLILRKKYFINVVFYTLEMKFFVCLLSVYDHIGT